MGRGGTTWDVDQGPLVRFSEKHVARALEAAKKCRERHEARGVWRHNRPDGRTDEVNAWAILAEYAVHAWLGLQFNWARMALGENDAGWDLVWKGRKIDVKWRTQRHTDVFVEKRMLPMKADWLVQVTPWDLETRTVQITGAASKSQMEKEGKEKQFRSDLPLNLVLEQRKLQTPWVLR